MRKHNINSCVVTQKIADIKIPRRKNIAAAEWASKLSPMERYPRGKFFDSIRKSRKRIIIDEAWILMKDLHLDLFDCRFGMEQN